MAKTAIQTWVSRLSHALLEKQLICAVAESCTGGLIAAAMTALPGASRWFDCGFVTYSNTAKHKLLGVPLATLDKYGAVSKATVIAMAEGTLKNSQAQLTVAVSGIAGPDGASQDKPLGTIWLAWASKHSPTQTKQYHLSGTRAEIRHQTVALALSGLIEQVENF